MPRHSTHKKTHLEASPSDTEDQRIIALENASVPAVALDTGRNEAHGQLVRQQTTQHHGNLCKNKRQKEKRRKEKRG